MAEAALQPGQLRWRCRRGMKELDILLERYVERRWQQAPPEERAAFEGLLEVQDPVIYGYCLGSAAVPDHLAALVERITANGDGER
jgi:antitoxin CptB